MSPVTDFIETTEALVDFAVTKLTAESTAWTVEKFPGTNYQDLFKLIPEMAMPCALVVYSGSGYDNKPRRTARIGVLVACETFSAGDEVNVRTLLDSAIAALDEQILNQARWKVVSDDPVEIHDGIAAMVVNFEVEDY